MTFLADTTVRRAHGMEEIVAYTPVQRLVQSQNKYLRVVREVLIAKILLHVRSTGQVGSQMGIAMAVSTTPRSVLGMGAIAARRPVKRR